MDTPRKPSKRHFPFLWTSHTGRPVLVQERRQEHHKYWHILEMRVHLPAGICWFHGQKWILAISKAVLTTPDHVSCLLGPPPLPLCPDGLDSSAMLPYFPAIIHVPWLILPVFCSKCLLTLGIYTPISVWYLWLVLEGPQGADKWECWVLLLPTICRRDSLHLLLACQPALVHLFWWHFLS